MYVIVFPGPLPGDALKPVLDRASLVLASPSGDPAAGPWQAVKDKIGVARDLAPGATGAAAAVLAHLLRLEES